MSVGKILRKIVKKWLKKDSETGGVVDPAEYELYAGTTTVPLVATGRNLDSEPCLHDCMFCVDGTSSYGGDLNRNRVHISDEMGYSEMGFSSDSIGSYRKKCRLDDEWDCELSSERTSYSSSCPLHGGIGLNSFMGDNNPTKFPFDASTCHSSQSPVPLCVCETCYIFVSSHLSLRLPSTPSSTSPRTPDAGGGGGGHPPLCGEPDDAGCWSNQRPTGPPDSTGKVSSGKMVRLGMTTKDVRTTTTTTDCNEDSSISVTSNRRFHSVMNPKSPSCSVEQLPKMTTTTTTGIGGSGGGGGGGGGGHVNLPQSVHVSLDGEEGFGEGQRRLRCINRWEDAMAHKSFRPPPNKTICHVAK